jgi:hypothetical protein
MQIRALMRITWQLLATSDRTRVCAAIRCTRSIPAISGRMKIRARMRNMALFLFSIDRMLMPSPRKGTFGHTRSVHIFIS